MVSKRERLWDFDGDSRSRSANSALPVPGCVRGRSRDVEEIIAEGIRSVAPDGTPAALRLAQEGLDRYTRPCVSEQSRHPRRMAVAGAGKSSKSGTRSAM